ncbi:uncharacterized protein KZ484_026451 [Pholidichthys leucotaenia]
MDTSSAPRLNYDHQYQWCSDSDLSSISSPETLSPIHSMDSSISPSSYQQPSQSTQKAAEARISQNLRSSPRSVPGRGRKTGRANRIRSKQRESASEKEKLRMRDLTKALHHLRSYLPPSVAPAGQTLTKIETLRLTIRYISYLSAQLGLSEEVLFRQRREQGDTTAGDGYFQNPSTGGQESQVQDQSQNLSQGSLDPTQCYTQNTVLYSGNCSFGVDQCSTQYGDATQGEMSMGTILQSSSVPPPSCQMCGKDFCTPLVPREYWG